jgi:FkbM family methyltransferase
MNPVNSIKGYLLSLGPRHPLLQLALKLQGRLRGYHIQFQDGKINVSTEGHRAILLEKDFLVVPIIFMYFADFEGKSVNGTEVLDFTGPCVCKHRSSGVEFFFSRVPSEDSMRAYLHAFKPSEGDIVWDIGANAGMTAYFFSQMVGPTGHVYAFEPDDLNRQNLVENLQRLQVKNVTVLDWAAGERSGRANFSMNASLVSGFMYCLQSTVYGNNLREVEVVSLEDCSKRLGHIPNFIKADIEGAEVGFIEGALEFLKAHSIHFAFESMHRMPAGDFSNIYLDKLFASIGYHVESSSRYGHIFTWATPGTNHDVPQS